MRHVNAYPGQTPWRRKNSVRPVNLQVSLSRETWEMWAIATVEERQAALDWCEVYRSHGQAFVLEMAHFKVPEAVLKRLMTADFTQVEPVVVRVVFYELERRRRGCRVPSDNGWGARFCVKLTRPEYERHIERRGELTTSEWASHLIFAEFEARGLDLQERAA